MKALQTEATQPNREIAALLWGVPAFGMRKHLEPGVKVFASSHPSPMSVTRPAKGEIPFRGSDPFNKVNAWLESRGASPIDWTLPD